MSPPSDHTATPAGFRRNAWLVSIGTDGWLGLESMAVFVGISMISDFALSVRRDAV